MSLKRQLSSKNWCKGCRGPSSDATDDTTSHEEKHRNYGGVYVGLPTDPSTCGSPSEAQAPSPPYTRSTKPDSSLAEDAC
ncbi:overexpressed in colon carcinoma 1 protein isoform X4 [Pyxicephalus adspersus]|uniref:overexpressed in colon carcinoma 1 protein isoform X4 n=1 Tax=Pyxicephalus adspersus TaxID=30357 RepID=UPI003B5AF3F4